jgi:hypothetical protein
MVGLKPQRDRGCNDARSGSLFVLVATDRFDFLSILRLTKYHISNNLGFMESGPEIDPFEELIGRDLKEAVLFCLAQSWISFNEDHAQQRMEERAVTTVQIEATLRSGALRTDGQGRDGAWRYAATGRGIEVIFTFDVDDDGTLLVVITAMRPRR